MSLVPSDIRDIDRSQLRSEATARLARNLGSVVISLIATLALWEGFIKIYHLQPVIAKSPIDIYHYLVNAHADKVHGLRSAAGNRQVLFRYLKRTAEDSTIGYVAGTVVALAVAVVFVSYRTVEQTFMPVALVGRCVPLIAMVPLITLIFGRATLCVAVVGGVVCFFPALINVMFGLRATPTSSLDLMTSYGASKATTMRKVLIPSAMPSIFAALRINVPGAVIGALLAEFLATGAGSGAEMQNALNQFDYGELWSAVVLVTLMSILAYSVVSAIEAGVLARFAPESLGGPR
jgi:ABC-type nitrate/sulfonate/bicarbonate transport system permease component